MSTQKGMLITDDEVKDASDSISRGSESFEHAKANSDDAENIAGAIKGKFTTALAQKAKVIGDEAEAAAVAVRKASDDAEQSFQQFKDVYNKKVLPTAKKTLLVESAQNAINDADESYEEAKDLSDKIIAIKNHDIDAQNKSLEFKQQVGEAVKAIEAVHKEITDATDKIKLTRNDAKNPVADTDDLFLKADAEDKLDGLKLDVAKLEREIVDKALVEANAFRSLVKSSKDSAEAERDKAQASGASKDDKKNAVGKIDKNYFESSVYRIAILYLKLHLDALKNQSWATDKAAIEQAEVDIEKYKAEVEVILKLVKTL